MMKKRANTPQYSASVSSGNSKSISSKVSNRGNDVVGPQCLDMLLYTLVCSQLLCKITIWNNMYAFNFVITVTSYIHHHSFLNESICYCYWLKNRRNSTLCCVHYNDGKMHSYVRATILTFFLWFCSLTERLDKKTVVSFWQNISATFPRDTHCWAQHPTVLKIVTSSIKLETMSLLT